MHLCSFSKSKHAHRPCLPTQTLHSSYLVMMTTSSTRMIQLLHRRRQTLWWQNASNRKRQSRGGWRGRSGKCRQRQSALLRRSRRQRRNRGSWRRQRWRGQHERRRDWRRNNRQNNGVQRRCMGQRGRWSGGEQRWWRHHLRLARVGHLLKSQTRLRKGWTRGQGSLSWRRTAHTASCGRRCVGGTRRGTHRVASCVDR